jgi:hypothetical protein
MLQMPPSATLGSHFLEPLTDTAVWFYRKEWYQIYLPTNYNNKKLGNIEKCKTWNIGKNTLCGVYSRERSSDQREIYV